MERQKERSVYGRHILEGTYIQYIPHKTNSRVHLGYADRKRLAGKRLTQTNT